MTSPLDNGNRWAVLGVAVAMMSVAGLVLDHAPALALVNESPSLPRGLYVRQPSAAPSRSAVVAVPQPLSIRPYLAGLGMPDEILLIKRVAAVGGETVCRDGDRVRTADRVAKALAKDRRGIALPVWVGCRQLAPDELFLLGDTAASFDSRYFGPVRKREITGVYREILTW